MKEELRKILEQGIEESGLSGQGDLIAKLSRLYDEIELFNPAYSLVNAQGRDLVVRHILDCLAPVSIMKTLAPQALSDLADLGSGSGLPGLVLASALEEGRITLVERMGRRAGFLRNTVAAMGLSSRVTVEQKDLSEVRNTYNAVTFRAFRPFKDIICDLDRILVPGGYIFAYKSSEENINEELEVIRSYGGCAFETDVRPYEVPMLDAKRSLLILKKC